MGNQHSASHNVLKPRKNVHWKSAGRPAVPGKPDIIPILSEDEPNAITLKWAPPAHDGGAPLKGYQVECNRLGSPDWIRTAPPVVLRPELVLSGLEPPHRYQFRVAALNVVGRSEFSELSDVLTVSSERGLQDPPIFLQHLEDVTVLENDKTEFRVSFSGSPTPTIAWFKDDYEIFSSRRTAITTNESSSVLIFHQTLSSDEGEIKCTATNRAGHAVTKARLSLEAAPKLRYPRQYEDGLLYEINETVFLKTTIVGKPTPTIEWRHDGQPIEGDSRVEITNTPKFSILKIQSARRSDRGEYQVHAKNNIGEDTAAFLVTITAPPDPPRRVSVTRQVDKSVTLDWEPPEDDGGCRIGNYVIEYYRSGWNVWLKATTSRKTNVTLFDLIEGSEYRFRVKAESPYGMSAPSVESAPVKIPGRSVDMEFLEVESRIINEVLKKEDSPLLTVSPAPRRKRMFGSSTVTSTTPEPPEPEPEPTLEPPKPKLRAVQQKAVRASPTRDHSGSSEIMIVLYPDSAKSAEKAEKRKSFQLDLEDALSPPPISLSAPELSSRCVMPFKALRNAVSSTELLHEQAMARFYKAVAMKEEQSKHKKEEPVKPEQNHIPYNNINHNIRDSHEKQKPNESNEIVSKPAETLVKTDSVEDKDKSRPQQVRQDSDNSEGKWQHMSFDEDYTASTVSTDGEYSDEGSLNGDVDRASQYSNEEDTYNPRDKTTLSLSLKESIEEQEEEEDIEREPLKPLRLPDPNFVPKPILKRREQSEQNTEVKTETMSLKNGDKNGEKKKEDKMTIFKKITKMPVQKSFPFPKILNKKDSEKVPHKVQKVDNKPVNKIENTEDKLGDEGKTIIDYYGNIVKEYGSHKKPSVPLYLNTEDLKNVAEKQQLNKTIKNTEEKKTVKTKKTVVKKPENNVTAAKPKPKKSVPDKQTKPNVAKVKLEEVVNTPVNKPPEKINKPVTPSKASDKNPQETQIVLRKAERATIVIPIDYQKLEQRAKMNVRSAIDYTVDLCLLLLAFWVYFFKDERLAIPFLILIIYRQLQETLFLNIPEWITRHTPSWLKKKTS
ncbi:uncharacterized protein MnM [Epargyreus clarus]|uniref:uncharacterized protein MnM n=1 Tax=Epargyreus clarus TaxID=520877 RepID=UPI003C2B3DE9